MQAECRDEIIAIDNPSSVTTYVDGSEGASLDHVKIPGVIQFEFGYLTDIVQDVLDMLISISPFATKLPNAQPPTHYRDEHAVFIDGVEVTDVPTQLQPGSVVTIRNLQPYSTKIEHGLSLQAPNGVYEVVVGMAAQRWGNSALISFDYQDVPAGNGPEARAKDWSKTGATRRRYGPFPTITIRDRR